MWIASQALACTTPVPNASLGAMHSRWVERSAQGATLVRESGNLSTWGVQVSTLCDGWALTGSGSFANGTRGYEGLSSRGAPLTTSSNIHDLAWSALAMRAVDERTSWGARVSYREIRRHIANAGAVLGYPETFHIWQAGLRAQHQLWASPEWQLQVHGEVGGGPGGRLDLQLPSADPVQLKLGHSTYVQLGVIAKSTSTDDTAPGWGWQARLRYRADRVQAGPASALFRNGVLVGGATQPATHILGLALDASLSYRF